MKRTKNRYHYEYKKCCKAADKIKKSKLLDSCFNDEEEKGEEQDAGFLETIVEFLDTVMTIGSWPPLSMHSRICSAPVKSMLPPTTFSSELTKTKLMNFLKKPRELPGLLLCGNALPWLDRSKHLCTESW